MTTIEHHATHIGLLRFKEGLKSYGLTYEELIRDWKYVGGDGGCRGKSEKEYGIKRIHRENYRFTYGDNNYPPLQTECVCGHKIHENCYLAKKDDINTMMVIGSCCIRKFMPKDEMKRKCIHCGVATRIRTRECLACVPRPKKDGRRGRKPRDKNTPTPVKAKFTDEDAIAVLLSGFSRTM